MFSENWDEPESRSTIPANGPLRGRVFGGRGRGFLKAIPNGTDSSPKGNNQEGTSIYGKRSGSERNSNSARSNDLGNRNSSERINNFSKSDASGNNKEQNWRETCGTGNEWRSIMSEHWNTRKYNASKYPDDDGERYGNRPSNRNSRKSNGSKYSDDEEGYGDRYSKRNSRKSNGSKYSDDEEGYGDRYSKRNSRKSNGSKYSDDEEGYGDRYSKRNSRKSNGSKYSDDEEGYGDRYSKRNSRKSNVSIYSDDEEGYGDRYSKRNSRKSNASKYSDDEGEGYGDKSSKWSSRKNNASKYSDDEAEGYGDKPSKYRSKKSNASKYSDDDRGYDEIRVDWVVKNSDEGEGSNSYRRENKDVRKKQGRNDNGYNKKDDKKGSQQPPKEPYIPNPDPENVEDLFSRNIESGINFDRYFDIEVSVAGENIPRKIENFEEAQVNGLIMENIRRSSYVTPTPVQKHALPIIMSGRDMMACAQTGSGKTAAFLIPTINCMLDSPDNPIASRRAATPQLLVVTPTRELAIQIYVEAKKLTYGSRLITEICYGGTAVRHQLNKVQSGCNILIATCGRLVDFLNRGVVSLNKLRHLIIDEADKMLHMSFLDDVESIIKHGTIDRDDPPQILLFSATFPDEVRKLAKMYLTDYIFIAVGIIGAACADVEQRFYLVYKADKTDRLIQLLEEELTRAKTLVFVQYKRVADILAAKLSEMGFPATSMHGDREQRQREEALKDFRLGKADILVATAVASRGLDIRGISYVINYDLPTSVDEYVHRIGRTGRVGNRGLAISFYDPDVDSSLVRGISRILEQAQQEIPSFFVESSSDEL